MALWEGFLECHTDVTARSDHQECLLDYLKTHEGYTKPETTKHLLSIGPGTGEIDHGLVSLLPHLASYTAVEPDADALNMVKGRLKEFTTIEKHYVNGVMETYTGPQCGADIILMSHVGYYFADSISQQIDRALSWLNKEGGTILLVQDEDTTNKILTPEFNIRSNTYDLISVDDVRRQLVNIGVNFTESAIGYTVDMSYPGPSYYSCLSVRLNRRVTKEEADKALTLLRPFFIPGTEKLPSTQTLFVIQKAPETMDDD